MWTLEAALASGLAASPQGHQLLTVDHLRFPPDASLVPYQDCQPIPHSQHTKGSSGTSPHHNSWKQVLFLLSISQRRRQTSGSSAPPQSDPGAATAASSVQGLHPLRWAGQPPDFSCPALTAGHLQGCGGPRDTSAWVAVFTTPCGRGTLTKLH